jgi:hypothetical protein
MKNLEFKVGDTVGEFNYGRGTGVIDQIKDDKAFVCWYEWSISDGWIEIIKLEMEPEGGF